MRTGLNVRKRVHIRGSIYEGAHGRGPGCVRVVLREDFGGGSGQKAGGTGQDDRSEQSASPGGPDYSGRRIPFGTNAKLGVGCIISSSVTVAREATVEDWSPIDTSGSVRIHGGEADE